MRNCLFCANCSMDFGDLTHTKSFDSIVVTSGTPAIWCGLDEGTKDLPDTNAGFDLRGLDDLREYLEKNENCKFFEPLLSKDIKSQCCNAPVRVIVSGYMKVYSCEKCKEKCNV